MKTRKRWAIWGSVAIVLVTAGLVLPVFEYYPNCGGNSAALSDCQNYILFLWSWSDDYKSGTFHYSQADPFYRHRLTALAGSTAIRPSHLLARVEDVRVDPNAEKRVFMVCDQAFDNVPRRRFRRAPMTHAVAYSTGETGLITPAEFARLDLSGFVDFQTLNETNVVEGSPANGNQPIRSETNGTSSAAGSRR
jgi:hypothetical protein